MSKLQPKIDTLTKVGTRVLTDFETKKVVFWLFESRVGFVQKLFANYFRPLKL